ncbi:hypothetical protein [Confluentibacter lentus]|uniref:hypothetical protein n=1 Tax=Confluentibacter lentus TaxID=1699412 RepID=UPI000C28836C|nr:hypothetical protein [Confluentibacter lentus]
MIKKFYRKELGEASLIESEPLIIDFSSKLYLILENAEQVGDSILEQIIRIYNEIIQQIGQTINYNDGQFVSQRQTVLNNLKSSKEQILGYWGQIAAIINFNLDNKTEYKQLIKELESEIEKGKIVNQKVADELKKQNDKVQSDADAIEEIKKTLQFELENFDKRYKDLLTSGEFLAQQDIFKKEADDHKKMSLYWLGGIIFSLLLLSFTLFIILKYFCFDLNCFSIETLSSYKSVCDDCGNQILWYEIIKSLIFRLFIISICVYILVFSIKNYNAHMHNKTINAHKENSFAAALALLNRAETSEGKDKLIVQAALSIFSHQKTGYIGKENEPNNPLFIEKLIDKIK